MTAPGNTNLHSDSTWGEIVPPAARVRIAIVTTFLVLAYWGAIRHTLVSRWIHDGNWSHGWLIPVLSLYFLSTQRAALARAMSRPSYIGAVVLAFSLSLYFVSAWWFRMAYPQALSIVGAIAGVTLLLGGWGVLRVAWFPILFLCFAVPLPHSIYVDLTMPLRRLATVAAAALMPLFAPGLHTEAQSVVIDYTWPTSATGLPTVSQGTLNVEEACSGMRLMMAFVVLGVSMAYLFVQSWWQRAIMVASCIPIAVFCNTIRVTVTGLLHVHGRSDLSRGTPHQLLGLVTLGVAMGLFSLLGFVLSHLFVEESEEEQS